MKKSFWLAGALLGLLLMSGCNKEDAATNLGTSSTKPATQKAYEKAQTEFADNNFAAAIAELEKAPQKTTAEKQDIKQEIEGIRLYQDVLSSYEEDELTAAQKKLAGKTIDPKAYQIAYVKLNAIKKATQREIEHPRSGKKETQKSTAKSSSKRTESSSTTTQTSNSSDKLANETTTLTSTEASSEKTTASEKEADATQLEASWQAKNVTDSQEDISLVIKNTGDQAVTVASDKLRIKFSDALIISDYDQVETVKPGESITFSDIFPNLTTEQAKKAFEVVYGDQPLLSHKAEPTTTSSENTTPVSEAEAKQTAEHVMAEKGVTDFSTRVYKEDGTLFVAVEDQQTQQELALFKVNDQQELEEVD